MWRWLSRAVAQGLVRQEGTGRARDPFRYWLPEREEFMRPEGDSEEALQAWNARCMAELFARPDRTNPEQPAQTAPLSGNDDPTAFPAVAALQAKVVPLEPVPPLDPGPETAAPAFPTPESLPAHLAQPVAPEPPGRLPYPYNIMNPADVPEEVWKQGRARKNNL